MTQYAEFSPEGYGSKSRSSCLHSNTLLIGPVRFSIFPGQFIYTTDFQIIPNFGVEETMQFTQTILCFG